MITLLGSQDRLPITLDEIKSACGITVTSIDTLIRDFISTACLMNGNCRWSRWSVPRNAKDTDATFQARCERLGTVIKVGPSVDGSHEVMVGPDENDVAKARRWVIVRIIGSSRADIRRAQRPSQVSA